LTGYGDNGPYRERKAYDLLLQGETGLVNVSGSPEEPAKVGISIVDIAGGMYTFSAILLALYQRQSTGRGQRLQISLFDAIAEWLQVPLLWSMHTGRDFPRAGLRHNMIVPYGPYRCGEDGSVNMAIQSQREWERFCQVVLKDEALVTDPLYVDNERRVQNRRELEHHIESEFARIGLEEVLRRLEQAEIAYGQVRQVREFAEHPQLQARDRWLQVDSPAGPIKMLKHPIEAPGWQQGPSRIPALGEHTDEILRELGLDEAEIHQLHEGKVV